MIVTLIQPNAFDWEHIGFWIEVKFSQANTILYAEEQSVSSVIFQKSSSSFTVRKKM
jgi:hypothetical protein